MLQLHEQARHSEPSVMPRCPGYHLSVRHRRLDAVAGLTRYVEYAT